MVIFHGHEVKVIIPYFLFIKWNLTYNRVWVFFFVFFLKHHVFKKRARHIRPKNAFGFGSLIFWVFEFG